MASGIFAILDDIALLLDDAATMSKLAAKKTVGVLGDDLAVNAEKATGFHSSRELPVIWAITKGSALNKLIILPLAFLLSAYASWAVLPILLLGGVYLCYEGAEKLQEWFHPHPKTPPAAKQCADALQLLQLEQSKIRAAVRTDFILSIEIIVITLGTVIEVPLQTQILVVSAIALLATVGVYGLVALIVRMDDAGFYLLERAASAGALAPVFSVCGRALVASLPQLIRLLGVVGTLAMLIVGGGMFVHNIDLMHQLLVRLPTLLSDLLFGLMVGGIALGAVSTFKLWRK